MSYSHITYISLKPWFECTLMTKKISTHRQVCEDFVLNFLLQCQTLHKFMSFKISWYVMHICIKIDAVHTLNEKGQLLRPVHVHEKYPF